MREEQIKTEAKRTGYSREGREKQSNSEGGR